MTSRDIWVVDVTDPAAPSVVDVHRIPQGSLEVAGDTIYVVGDGLFALRTTNSSIE